jgi:hypothetical protein
MISIVHGNDDAQKSADLRQGFLPLCVQAGFMCLDSHVLNRD